MRAVYIEDLTDDEFITIEGEDSHHLINVVRIQKGEKILLMNGKGYFADGEVELIQKKRVTFKVHNKTHHEKIGQITLAIAVTKKDAFNEMIRSATEMGINRVIPFYSEFSQRLKPNYEKINKIMINALTQSNNPYLPQVDKVVDFDDLLSLLPEFENKILFSLADHHSTNLKSKSSTLIIIGPEGGLSPSENEQLIKMGSTSVHLPTPILTAPVACCVALGFVLGKVS